MGSAGVESVSASLHGFDCTASASSRSAVALEIMRILFRLSLGAALVAISACASSTTTTPSDKPTFDTSTRSPESAVVQVMVLPMYHMAGSRSDLINVKADSVLTDRRQHELRVLVDALTTFEPTVVFTERVTAPPDYVDPKFADFTEAMLKESQNERVQVAYRLARRAKVTRVHGIDEQTSEGEPDYFPFGRLMAHAAETGQKAKLEGVLAEAKAMVETFTAQTRDDSIARKLLKIREGPMSSADFYYRLAAFDVGESQPAAELQAYWFMRNTKIWSKLHDVAKPGDRAVVVFGAGHRFWLEHLIRHSPGFALVDPTPYLEAADAAK